MSLYKELIPFIEYIHSIRKLKTYLSFDMKFPIKWGIPKSLIDEGQVVGFESDDQNLKGLSFVTEIDEQSISSTLTKVAKIIKLNKEKELKEALFRDTVERLKTTFEQTNLEKLQNLYFDFDNEEPNLSIDESEITGTENFELVGEREEKGQKRTRPSKKVVSTTNEEA
jgi:hypothetical protein